MDGEQAGLRTALEHVGDRWTLLIVAALFEGPRRFGDLARAVAGIAPNVLSQRLKAMEASGLVLATPYQQRPVRMSYELTARGRDLVGPIRLLTAWADASEGPPHAACGTPLDARWWCPTCESVAQAPEDEVHHL